MKYSIKFFPEKRKDHEIDSNSIITLNVPILCSITWKGKRIFHYTGIRCDVDPKPKKGQWNFEKEEIRQNQILSDGRSAAVANAELTKIRHAIDEIFTAYSVSKIDPTPLLLRNDLKIKLDKDPKNTKINIIHTYFDNFINTSKSHSSSTSSTLKDLAKKLKNFGENLFFEDFDTNKFESFLFANYKVKNNSVVIIMSWLNTFFKWAISNELTLHNPFKYYKPRQGKYGQPVYITIEERDILLNATFSNPLYEFVRDMFVAQCFIGCRYSDLVRLKRSNIVGNNIEYVPIKTKNKSVQIIRVPLTEKVKQIFSKYKTSDGSLFPPIVYTRFTNIIKSVFHKCGITRLVTVSDRTTGLEKQVPICDIAASHMARRCFIGGLVKKGVSDKITVSMTGHSVNSRALTRYYNVDNDMQKDAIKLIE